MGWPTEPRWRTPTSAACYQPASGGSITNLYGGNLAQHVFTSSARPTGGGSAVLAPGTYNVGMCVRNNGASIISNNNFVNGWAMVTADPRHRTDRPRPPPRPAGPAASGSLDRS